MDSTNIINDFLFYLHLKKKILAEAKHVCLTHCTYLIGPEGYKKGVTTKELQLTMDSLNDASDYEVSISASVKIEG